jgi:uncharacterized SAM-binding protein YcdF (DUF218 family)
MFFIISKILVVLIRPLFWILVLLIWALAGKKPVRRKWLLGISAGLLIVSANKVIVNELAIMWEPGANKVQTLPRTAVVLGGFSKYDEYRNQIAISEAGERLFKVVELYKSRLIDTIIISGGAASLTGQIRPESIYARIYLIKLGIDSNHIWIDSQSLNTHENALQTAAILRKWGEIRPVTLITSAFHMKRSVKTFQKAGIPVVPMPVQFVSNPNRGYIFSDYLVPSSEALFHFDAFIKEFVGYAVYRITGKA